ncbi:uncharacterized protein LOC143295208 [Babylonia areolata]|uniref:uncharacterized protein LOC143295208 n=1 Tax=Babylonia areolata TaxID=304850 RepID=UPI003FD18565
MEPEICIPTDRVPPEILQKLKEIGLLLQSESFPSPKKDADERDDLGVSGSQRHAVVHVLSPVRVKDTRRDSDVVSLFDNNQQKDGHCSTGVLDHRTDNNDGFGHRTDSDRHARRAADSDVVSLFHPRPSPSKKDSQSSRLEATSQGKKESEGAFEHRGSSPLQNVMNQTPRPLQAQDVMNQTPRPLQAQVQCQPQPHSSPPVHPAPGCSQVGSQQPFSALSPCPRQPDTPDLYGLHSRKHPRSSPFQPLPATQDGEDERRLVNSRSPCKTPKRYDDSSRPHHPSPSSSSTFLHHSPSSSSTFLHHSPGSEASSSAVPASSSSSLSSRSRSPPSQQSCSNDDDLLHRGFPSGAGSTAREGEQKSPKVLTPPETPENDVKRVVPEVFTFDDLACTQERLRQTSERLYKLHEQFTPTKRSPSTPRHPPSTPTTPSYARRQDVLPSPTVRPRLSPLDPRYLQHMEATGGAVTLSPQPKLKTSEVPESPVPGLQSTTSTTPQRLSVPEGYSSPQRRDSLSPNPKKRLSFDEDGGVPCQLFQSQRSQRTYDASALPYPPHLPSPRPSGSGSENPFPFPSYAMEGQPFGRLTPSKAAHSMAEFQRRMTSLAAFHEGRETGEEEEEEGAFFSGMRHVYESFELQNRMAMQNGRFTPKRKRSELNDDGSDGVAVCTCAVMERNFLQMAECAYKRIRRMDATPADFDRFRNELAQTNEILRESMGLMKHIRDLCDHRKRPRW